MTWRTLLVTLPEPGTVVDVDGQLFSCIKIDELRKAGGAKVPVAVWRSKCAECGAEFFTRTATSSNGPSRRCRRHRHGGAHVASGPSRPVNVRLISPANPNRQLEKIQ